MPSESGPSLLRELRASDPAVAEVIEREFVSLLLSYQYTWRERRVQSITPVDAHHYRDRVSLQFVIHATQITRVLREIRTRLPTTQEAWIPKLDRLLGAEWADEWITLPIPIVVLPKKVLLTPHFEDSSGKRLTLNNRLRNSDFIRFHIVRALAHAQTDTGALGIDKLEPLIQTLAFCMPEGILHKTNFKRAELSGRSSIEAANEVSAFLKDSGIPLQHRDRPEIRRQCRGAIAVLDSLTESHLWDEVEGLRDPLVFPLLLGPDFMKLTARGPTKNGRARFEQFLTLTGSFLHVVSQLANAAQSDLARHALLTLSRFTYMWAAIAPIEVAIESPSLVKLTTTVRLERKGFQLPFGGLDHGYAITVGDAQSTHIEIASPDPSTVRISRRSTRLSFGHGFRTKGPAGLRVVFGFEHSLSNDLLALYTTKSRGELVDLIGRLDDEVSEKLPVLSRVRMWVRSWMRAIVRLIRRKPDPAVKMPSRRERAFEEVVLGVRYRLRLGVNALYLPATVAAVATAVGVITRLEKITSGAPALIPASVALLAGILTVRERALPARVMLYMRSALVAAFIALLATVVYAVWAIERPDRSNACEQPTEGVDPSPGGIRTVPKPDCRRDQEATEEPASSL